MPSRRIEQADARVWLAENAAPDDASVITSLPDVSEMGGLALEGWKTWFVDAAAQVIRWVPERGVAIFYQSDIRHGGEWIDKGYLVMSAAARERASIAWHKIVCRRRAGTLSLGRATYSHMICVARTVRPSTKPAPDVLPDAGVMPWSRAMGVEACRVACRYVIDETPSRVVVDPFCGRGTVLAIANDLGLDAIGVDTNGKRCRAARSLTLP